MGDCVVCDDDGSFVGSGEECFEIVDVFVFGCVEEYEVKLGWFCGEVFWCVAEDLGDEGGEFCFGEVFFCQVESEFFVGFYGVELVGFAFGCC